MVTARAIWWEYMEKDFVCQWNIGHKTWGVLLIIVQEMYRIGCLFDKSAHLIGDHTFDIPAFIYGKVMDFLLY
jgi:hypothetical protein